MVIEEYTHTIVKNFKTHFPIAYKSMHQVSHNEDPIFSKWHLEGSIWTHTMMVLSAMQQHVKNHHAQKELLLAALLHDTGKVYTRNVDHKNQKVTFYGHPGVSTFLARNMLPKIDPTLSKEQQLCILYLINHHQTLFNLKDDMSGKAFQKLVDKFDGSYDLLDDLIIFRNADSAGRISTKKEGTSSTQFVKLADAVAANPTTNTPINTTSAIDTPKAVIMVGLPGTGKSTYASSYLKDYTLVSRDAQITQLMGDMDYNEAFKLVDQQEVDKLYEQTFAKAVQMKENLVVDKTNLTHKSRMKSIRRLQDNGYRVKIIVLLPTLLTLHRRNQKREGKTIPTKVIRNMMSTLELPFQSEGSVDIILDF
jgi:predicted kinase